jgi:hypothetical protein
MWVPMTELPTSASHPFYARLNQLLRPGHINILKRVLLHASESISA